VRPVNAAGQKLPFSAVWRFVKRSAGPQLYGPADNSHLQGMPVFTWQQIPRAAQYEIQVSLNDPSFQSTPIDTAKVNVGAYAPKTIYAPNTRFAYYYWRVRAIDSNGNVGAFTPGRRFHLTFRYPLLVAPARNEVLTTKYPVFGWQVLPGAASYSLEISVVPDFSTVAQTIPTEGTAWTPNTPLAIGTYYWRVRAVDGAGGLGLPSIARPFVVPSVTITSAYLANSSGVPTTTFPKDTKVVYISLSWQYADPTKDTFQLVLFNEKGQQVTQSTVTPFPSAKGSELFSYQSTLNGTPVPLSSGKNRLDLVVNGKTDRSLFFTVK
jgi:hypothetical protein